MKSNIEKVYSKLPKTELAKVELGSLKNLENGVKAAKKEIEYLLKEENKLEEFIRAANKHRTGLKGRIGQSESLYKAIVSDYNDFKSKAKELGIAIGSMPIEKEFNKASSELKSVTKTIDSLTKNPIA